MPHRVHHAQLAALDEQGERHVLRITRVQVPGSTHLQGPPQYTWNNGQPLHLVDAKAGILECPLTGKRLQIEDWRG